MQSSLTRVGAWECRKRHGQSCCRLWKARVNEVGRSEHQGKHAARSSRLGPHPPSRTTLRHMVQVLLILLYGSIYLHDGLKEAPGGTDLNPLKVAATTLAGFFAIWLALHAMATWWGSQIANTGRVRWIHIAERWLTLSRLAGAAWWTYCLFDLGWLQAVRRAVGDLWLIDELLAMSPFIALLVGGWWSLYPVERRFHEAFLMRQLDSPDAQPIHPILSRSAQVWMAARHQLLLWMLPLTLMMGWREL